MKTTKTLWKRKLGRLVKEKSREIIYPGQKIAAGKPVQPEKPGQREKEGGGKEKGYRGFRSGIFYFKLSTLVDLDVASDVVREITRIINPPHKHRYAALFLNNELNELMHPRSMVAGDGAVEKIMRDFYDKYAHECELFSGVMEELFPRLNFLVKDAYPGNADMCVIITDRHGIEIAPPLLKRLSKTQNNWLIINTDKYRPVDITEMAEII